MDCGADVKDLKQHLQALSRIERHGSYGALLTAACAGTWTRRRKRDCFGGEEMPCECGRDLGQVRGTWAGAQRGQIARQRGGARA